CGDLPFPVRITESLRRPRFFLGYPWVTNRADIDNCAPLRARNPARCKWRAARLHPACSFSIRRDLKSAGYEQTAAGSPRARDTTRYAWGCSTDDPHL